MTDQSAEISLLGNRSENQDRVKIVKADRATLLIAIDGMGGHANGERAAELAVQVIEENFLAQEHPIFDPQGFLHMAIGKAHAAVVQLGEKLSVETRPRATCALCLIQDNSAYWGHCGDSRVYHLRGTSIHERTRDHSHVEVLLHDGSITPEQAAIHPMRNYVECCLGGDSELPRMTISTRKELEHGDVMLVCSDGFWSPLQEAQLAGLGSVNGSLANALETLGNLATKLAAPHSDNTSAAAFSFRSVV